MPPPRAYSCLPRGANTTSLRHSALAQRQCTGLLRQGIRVRILGAELSAFCDNVATNDAATGRVPGLSDGFRALPCKRSHGSSTLPSSTLGFGYASAIVLRVSSNGKDPSLPNW